MNLFEEVKEETNTKNIQENKLEEKIEKNIKEENRIKEIKNKPSATFVTIV